jgi:tetratricopeptide (TPR) repeat protein
MRAHFARPFLVAGTFALFLAVALARPVRQTGGQTTLATIEGQLRDTKNAPVAGVVVSLERTDSRETAKTSSDSGGHFRFESVPPGRYTLHARYVQYPECVEGPFVLNDHDRKSFLLVLAPPGCSKDASEMAFSDEPSFTVAGVTDTTSLGGHGSGPIVRNSNALSKEAASLSREDSARSGVSAHDVSSQESAIRSALAHQDDADLRARLAEIEESEGNPLDAVRNYQRAAEMEPTESHLFAWGAELLLHHATEPAIEVFTKGHRLFAKSSRMMLGLGAAWYAERSKEQAEQLFLQACDVNPSDPTPYLFLGRLQATEQTLSDQWVERMKRLVTIHPESAMAHYLYGVALRKQDGHRNYFAAAEAELQTAIQLDAHLGDAYLQLGILCAEREDFAAAISALQKAVENTPAPMDAHYRLAQIYRRMGDAENADREAAEYRRLSEEDNKQAERERHEVPQFVYTLRGANPPALPSSANQN